MCDHPCLGKLETLFFDDIAFKVLIHVEFQRITSIRTTPLFEGVQILCVRLRKFVLRIAFDEPL